MTLRIFVSHSFDHPDKLLRILKFMQMRNVTYTDRSVPVWDQLNDHNPQIEIERRIRTVDRVLVILTRNSHKSEWIKQEVAWARHYGKPVIGIWPHGEAGSPVPRGVLEANAHLIGWRATSLEKALSLEDVGDYRALDLAEDADFDRAVRRVVEAAGVASLLLIGVQAYQLLKLQRTLCELGIRVDLVTDWWSMAEHALKGAAIGGLIGLAAGELTGCTSRQTERLAVRAAGLGASMAVNVYLHAQIRRFGALTTIELQQRT